MRVGGVLMAFLILGITAAIVRRGAFAPRLVVELREDRRHDGRSLVAVTAGGRPAAADVRLRLADGERLSHSTADDLPEFTALRSVGVELPTGRARELKVWAHTISVEGTSENLPVVVAVHDGDEQSDVNLGTSGGQAVVRLKNESCRLEFALPALP